MKKKCYKCGGKKYQFAGITSFEETPSNFQSAFEFNPRNPSFNPNSGILGDDRNLHFDIAKLFPNNTIPQDALSNFGPPQEETASSTSQPNTFQNTNTPQWNPAQTAANMRWLRMGLTGISNEVAKRRELQSMLEGNSRRRWDNIQQVDNVIKEGNLYGYREGGETLATSQNLGTVETPIKKVDLRKVIPNFKTQKGSVYKKGCPDGIGCSEQATDNAASLLGIDRNKFIPGNAAYRTKLFENYNMQKIWNPYDLKNVDENFQPLPESEYKNLLVGDQVGLTRGNTSFFNYDPPKGLSSKDNNNVEHFGTVTGFTEDGRPIIKHGYATKENKGNYIEEALSKDGSVSSLGHGRYKPAVIYRVPGVESGQVNSVKNVVIPAEEVARNKANTSTGTFFNLKDTREEEFMRDLPVAAEFSGASTRLNTKNSIVNMFNDKKLDEELKYKLNISQQDLDGLKPVIYGIAGQESNFNDIDSMARSLKEEAGDLIGGNSKGLYQVKYSSLTPKEREVAGITSENDLKDDKKAYVASLLLLKNAKARMDKEVEKGTHPELKDKDPYFRAAYFYNSPVRSLNTAEEWGTTSKPVTINPTSWLNPLKTRNRDGILESINMDFAKQNELRMDEGSYPYKLMEKAKDLNMSFDNSIPAELENVYVIGKKDKTSTLKLNPRKKGGWIQDAVNPEHKGYCTPMTKSTCTPRRKALARTFKKHHGFHEEGGEILNEGGLWDTNKTGYVDSVFNANMDKDWVKRLYQKNPPSIQLPNEPYPSTHMMESGDGRVYPTIQMVNGKLQNLGANAYNFADSTKSYIQFPNDQMAQWFGKNYKQGTGVLPKHAKGGVKEKLIDFILEDDEDEASSSVTSKQNYENTAPSEDEVQQATVKMAEEDEYNQTIAMLFGDENSIGNVDNIPQTVTQTENITPSQSNPKGGSDQMQYAFKYLQQKGLAPHVAAGIVGNLQQESDINPRAVGDKGTSRGIAQWHNERWTNLVNAAQQQGADPHSLEFQLDYLIQEASQRGDLQRISKAKDSGEAAKLFNYHFEGSVDSRNHGRGEQNRIRHARSLFQSGGTYEITEQEYLDLISQGYNITTL